MVTEKGIELIIGSSTDRQFGPVVLFGAGGVLVEVLQDRALGLPPLNRTLARRLMERTRIYPALQGVRGQKPVDLEALETMLARFSQLLTDFVEDIQEVDMNPVLAAPGRVVALDARVLLTPADRPADERPRLAIHPYPNQYTAPFRLRDGSEVTVRAIGPEDEPLIVDLHADHSEHTIRMRFFSLVKTLSRDSLIRLCHLDYDREMALVAVRRDDGGSHMLGVSRYYLEPGDGRGGVRAGGRRRPPAAGSGKASDATADRDRPGARRPAADRAGAARERADAGADEFAGLRPGGDGR